MRTNIVLNDDLAREAMRFSRARNKSALVEEALRVFVELRWSEERIKTYEKRLPCRWMFRSSPASAARRRG